MKHWFFSYRFVDDFARQLIEEVAPLFPAADAVSDKIKAAAARQQQTEVALALLESKAVEFGRRERLNLFQKARLSKGVQDQLIRRGQSAQLAGSVAMNIAAAI